MNHRIIKHTCRVGTCIHRDGRLQYSIAKRIMPGDTASSSSGRRAHLRKLQVSIEEIARFNEVFTHVRITNGFCWRTDKTKLGNPTPAGSKTPIGNRSS